MRRRLGSRSAPTGTAPRTNFLSVYQGVAATPRWGPTSRPIFNLTTVEGLNLAAFGFEKDVAKLSCCAG